MIVLDTHALVWWVSEDPTLSQVAKAAIVNEQNSGRILVSAITAWEVAALVARERLVLSMDAGSWFAAVGQLDAVHIVPVDAEIAIKSADLPGAFHEDPADRFIVATARKYAAPLVTHDDRMRAYAHVKTIW
ncbi:type II toxin-antitoxin system VapC family toxin [Cupriavidus basilensis]